MKKTPFSDQDIKFHLAQAKHFSEWIFAMLFLTRENCGAKSLQYRQLLRLIHILQKWQDAMNELKPISTPEAPRGGSRTNQEQRDGPAEFPDNPGDGTR